ncbi:trichohyalin-like [Xyrichtys novacula]|uniref:Trichohyalin-like n=1 Tax=Xyrichtys novacula TaxID=13765 RepID=A0AAV1GK99_XYRNO|nr:trichohyalin-like [Xyrichtys novacula]
MSTDTRRRHSPPGKPHDSVNNQEQHSSASDRRADPNSLPFPTKAVFHRPSEIALYSRHMRQGSHHSATRSGHVKENTRGKGRYEEDDGTWKERGGQIPNPGKDTLRQPNEELEMSWDIHEMKLMLAEKLWRVEKLERQKNIQRDLDSAADGEDYDRRRAERGRTQTKPRLSEQQGRDAMTGRGVIMQDRRQEDAKEQTKRQDGRMEDRIRNRHVEEKRDTWREERREVGVEQLHRKEQQGTQMYKSRWENVKEYTRGKGRYEEDDGTWKERGGRSTGKATERHVHSSVQEQKELRSTESATNSPQLLPCRVCNRTFASERVEKHIAICKKVKKSTRPVYDSSAHRAKGAALAEYLKYHSRAQSPEAVKRRRRQRR